MVTVVVGGGGGVGIKYWIWEFFVEALDEFPSYFIQSETSPSDHEYSENDRANKFVMSLSNFWDEQRGLTQSPEAVCRH